ncbi:uncharacterized protein LOC134832131 [Culicoides brevitarsis]|uniref:uncharacterized protein LOC134832131 n=1 Tax=Culicoides brevitarsis TaxID=469753 RepID=UPI00307CA8CB
MSSEVEIGRNGTMPSSTLPDVVLAASDEEFDFGMNLITTMAASRRENIVEMGSVAATTTIASKVMDVNSSRNSSVANSPRSVAEDVATGRVNDSEGVSLIVDDNSRSANNNISSNLRSSSNDDVPTISVDVSESFALEDTDTDDDVILVVQPIETIELLGDDDDGDVQIVNSDEPIPKPKRLPQKLHKSVIQPTSSTSSSSTNTSSTSDFPGPPRLSEPSVSAMMPDDEHLTPILDLLDDHFGCQFDLPPPMHLPTDPHHHSDFATIQNRSMLATGTTQDFSKPTSGLFVSHLTNSMGTQTGCDLKPEKKDMETQTDGVSFCAKRKISYLENDLDGDECPICYEPWEESGKHSLVSLKCGHLFGDSCLKKWLNDQHAQQKLRLCPVCRTKVEVKHIRTLYARRVIQVKADPELKRLRAELEVARERAKKYETQCRSLDSKLQACYSHMNNAGATSDHGRGPSTSQNPPRLIHATPLLRQQPPVPLQQQQQQHALRAVTAIPSALQLSVPTTSRAALTSILPSSFLTQEFHQIGRYEFPRDFFDQRTINQM